MTATRRDTAIEWAKQKRPRVTRVTVSGVEVPLPAYRPWVTLAAKLDQAPDGASVEFFADSVLLRSVVLAAPRKQKPAQKEPKTVSYDMDRLERTLKDLLDEQRDTNKILRAHTAMLEQAINLAKSTAEKPAEETMSVGEVVGVLKELREMAPPKKRRRRKKKEGDK